VIPRPPPPGAPAMLYTREACRAQEPGESSAQETACRALAEAHSLKCVGIRSDVGSSRVPLRAGLQDVLQLARERTFQVLVAASLDRLTRDRGELKHIFNALDSAGVVVLTMEEGFLTSAPSSPARSDSPFQQHSLRGLRQASKRPGLSPKLVRSLHAAYAAGLSTGDLCEALNSQGVQSPRA
jgi:hypothetical protein